MNDRTLSLKSRRVWIAVAILFLLPGCRTRVTVISHAPTVTRTLTPSQTPGGKLREDGLTPEEAATLSSLDKVDDHPLYTMYYQGEYDSLGSSHFREMQLKALNPGSLEEVWSSPWSCSLFSALGDTTDMHFGRNFDWRFSPALPTSPRNGGSVERAGSHGIAFRGLAGIHPVVGGLRDEQGRGQCDHGPEIWSGSHVFSP